MTGESISHYFILEKLGEGGMGVVYKARDTRLDRVVALKFLPPERLADPDRKRRFAREARAASALNHPGIVTIYDIDAAEGRDFISMEYVPGATLQQRLASGKLPSGEAVKYAIDIAAALEAAHREGIVHRDLKPGNIMLSEAGQVKVLDFGLAKLAAGGESTATAVVGTFAYMSPEQAEGRPADARSDIYSFGAVLYEMLTGRRAFASLRRDEPPVSAELPAEASQIVSRCLRRDPQERFQTAAELKTALERLRSAPQADACPAIAVLPFANLSADKENEYFSDGLAEEIINALAALPGLRVAARTSAFAFRGKDQDVREIGARLNVGYVLEGSVRRAGNRLRITAQLISVADGYHLWSERYDREMTDVFAIQDEICQAIVERLRVRLAAGRPLVRRYTENTEAYNLYLKGRHHLFKFTPEGLAKSKEYFEQAIRVDPDYPMAYGGLALYHYHAGFFGLQRPRDAAARCGELVSKVLELDERIPEAHGMAGMLRAQEYDWPGAECEFRRGFELDPDSADVWASYDYYWLVPMRRLEEAVAVSRRALERDPLSPFLQWRLGYRYYLARQDELAVQQFRNALELDPNYFVAHGFLGAVYVQQGRCDEGLRALETASALSGQVPFAAGWLGAAYARAGRTAEARATLERLLELERTTYVPPSSIGVILFRLGEIDRGFDWLEKAVDERDGVALHLHVNPGFDSVRSHPRYRALLRKMNLEP